MRLSIQFLSLVILQAIHSLEEYLTRLNDWFPIVTGRLHDTTGFFPAASMSSKTFAALNLAFIVVLLVTGISVFRRKRWAYRLAFVITIVELLNGMLHLFGAIYTGGYFPGSISAGGLFIIAILLIRSFMTGPPSAKDRRA